MTHETESTVAPTGREAQEPIDVSAQADAAAGGSDEPNEEAREVVSRAELAKVIAERQAAKDRARKAEQALTALREQLPDSTESTAGQDCAAGDEGLAVADPAGSPAASPQPPDGELSALRKRLRSREDQLAGILRDQRLRTAAAKAGAVNPDQMVAMLRSHVVMAEGSDGQFAPGILDASGRPLLDDNGSPMGLETFVARFLSQPDNANLLRSSSAPGSGAKPAGGSTGAEVAPRTLAQFNALPPERRRAVALGISRQQRQALLGLTPSAEAGYL